MALTGTHFVRTLRPALDTAREIWPKLPAG